MRRSTRCPAGGTLHDASAASSAPASACHGAASLRGGPGGAAGGGVRGAWLPLRLCGAARHCCGSWGSAPKPPRRSAARKEGRHPRASAGAASACCEWHPAGESAPPVWPKNSCGFTLVVFEEASKPFTTSNGAYTFRVLADGRKEQHIALALVIALVMIMLHILVEGLPYRPLSPKRINRERHSSLTDLTHRSA